MIGSARSGTSSVLVLRGDAGVGKTALLDYVTDAASEFRLLYAAGVESEMELAFAALHQLCAPSLDRLTDLPAPQREALETVFGLREGAPPDHFMVGLAVLTLVSEVSGDQPLLCVVDDAQWLDRASAQVLGLVARRLRAESVAFLFGTREPPGAELAGLSQLEITGLRDVDARILLAPIFRYVRDDSTRRRIVAEARGNPLALLELPRGLAVDELAGRLRPHEEQPLSKRIEDSFLARVEELPGDARLLLLVAAAEPVGDSVLFWRAAEHLGLDVDATGGNEFKALLAIDDRVTFRHPLVRSAVYRAGSVKDRRRVHLALSVVTDQQADPDRRAWHLASAAVGPDESVAEELERSAGRAQARGGLVAAAAFLQRSVALTELQALRVGRALAAAEVSLHAGEFDLASRMVALAEAGTMDEAQHARARLLRGQMAFALGDPRGAIRDLLSAADRLRTLDVKAARLTYLEAWGAAVVTGEPTGDISVFAVSAAAASLPPAEDPGPTDILLDGLVTLITSGRMAAAPILRRAIAAFASPDTSVEDSMRWGWMMSNPPTVLWDERAWHDIGLRQLDLTRSAGALARLSLAASSMSIVLALRGDFAAAATVIREVDAVVDVTGLEILPLGKIVTAALGGMEAEATALLDALAEGSAASGQLFGVQFSLLARATLLNGLSRYGDAFAAADRASSEAPELFISAWALPELIEAGVRSDNRAGLRVALDRLTEAADAADTDWARGVEVRCRALLSDGDVAERCYQEALERLARTQLRPELARTHLLYGEWLRGQGREIDARLQLHTAHDLFTLIGMEGFAERARRELLATGEKVVKRTTESSAADELTAQERQIALLARDGLSNPEVGARLFLSSRTVEWHLRKIFVKLSISSRRQLRQALQGADWAPPPS